ncbi:hypothetical protein HJG53_15345 [Sphingomonas sp. ID1715]|uniref:hypothetical protein n=1 Tax=Sphingomonas sp. ID1715 TaxID=1656898 RepID=UPI001489D42A|nr:hypothetical protein [Sphingomonas sp. ID1715]NNM78267.1 hypothetical protein [Sphingomonas sp. ID1715]
MRFEDLTPDQRRAAELMTQGGDARIVLTPDRWQNRYYSAPYPQDVLAYASSTANDISGDAFAHIVSLGEQDYAAGLESLRRRIRAAYGVADDVAVVFAPSGTDLEYVALACVADRAERLHNILLGADEVGSGCIHSAHGRYFAKETALGQAVTPGEPVPGLGERVTIEDIAVRDALGHAFTSASIRDRIEQALDGHADAHALVHVVHGSKTGLILPLLEDIDDLLARHQGQATLVVDACQARITSPAIGDYLARDAIVFITGSKFMGGPPFSGFALVPPSLAHKAPALPEGFASIFRRAEWPAGWPGADALEDGANPGLLLRLSASVFELERFQRLSLDRVTRVILAFHAAVRTAMVERLGGRRMAPYPPGHRTEGDAHPIEMRTLSTIDFSGRPGRPDFDEAVRLHKALVDRGIRLGQPVKCVKLEDGRWGATLRLGLSMPQLVGFDALDDAELHARLAADMDRIADAIACA